MEDSALLFIPILKVTTVPNASQIFQASGAFIGVPLFLSFIPVAYPCVQDLPSLWRGLNGEL